MAKLYPVGNPKTLFSPHSSPRTPRRVLPPPQLDTGSSRWMGSPQTKTVGQSYRAIVLLLLASLLILAGLGSRLAYIQLVQTQYYRQLADTNRIRLLPQPPERGRIVDRNGVLLAGSQLSHSVFLWPLVQSRQRWQEMIPTLAQYLQIAPEEIEQKLEQAGYRSPFPVRILRNASPQVVIQLEEMSRELPGVMVEAETIRLYPNGDLAAHLLGYTGEIPQEKLQANPDYRLGDIVGLMGAEELFEAHLRGQWGGRQVEVDAMGEVLRVLGEQAPQPGKTLQLTLDVRLQQVAEQALANRKGAVIAMDPRDGSILAMASYPTFDPNLFSSRITQAQWDTLQQQEFPFLNRGMRAYAPASTYKIITTAAGIESGAFPPGTVLQTAPYVQVGGWRFWDWNRVGFGRLNYRQAMAWSSDTFFYQIALGTKVGPLQEWSRRFGLGQPTGIGLKGEALGLVPDADWKQRHWREPWYVGDTVNMSIGQGFITATPLQMAVVTAAVANGGWRVRPLLSQQVIPENPVPMRQSVGMSGATLQILQQGLRDVVVFGTGGNANLGPGFPPTAGKTGTAEDPPRRSHAWYVGYAPYDQPELVVVVFLENSGGGGGAQAAPVFREVMRAYFQPES
ncbi:penicillin-binding protein 2 [Synechococcus sp. Nb3U1]|uniref:penicillin-binding protein 2 n=1 Tax=Synechococcus sp. Nb3U1 TaxID=1914529 RepID=UPI001F1A5937|nr:penicillin-binding protein 2 [Synechococcus sp. Nb3U1]MCF2970658.1 penicillin-binding protein 2 [Synechococcus sp. Nb3U1]